MSEDRSSARSGRERWRRILGIAFDSVGPIARIPTLVELNIGHFLVGEAIFGGLDRAIRRMRELMDAARRMPRRDDRVSARA